MELTPLLILLFYIIGWNSTNGNKTQFIRLLDIFIYGPILIYISLYQIKSQVFKLILLFMGTTTISYNLRNYLKHKESTKDE